MHKFICTNCELVFESQNLEKNEYIDPIFGPCWNYTAVCPECGSVSNEKTEKKNSRNSTARTANRSFADQ